MSNKFLKIFAVAWERGDFFKTYSNLLTLLRVFLTPLLVGGIFFHLWKTSFLILVVACLTDILDGYFARLFNEQTEVGALLDPIADKFLLISCFFSLTFVATPSFHVPGWFFVVVFIREFFLIGGTLFLFLFGIDLKIEPLASGKLTTFFQLSLIVWIFLCRFFVWNPIKTYTAFLSLLTVFSMVSFGQYWIIGWRYLKNVVSS
jgi:cardiolipin synthase (CMP-forming)